MKSIAKPIVLIPAAAGPRPQILSVAPGVQSSTMVTVSGKPIIGWILDELTQQGFTQFLVLIPNNDEQIKSYVNHRNIEAMYVATGDSGVRPGLAYSILQGLEAVKNSDFLTEDILIILGHTLILGQQFDFRSDWVLHGEVTEEASRWCYFEEDSRGNIHKLIDKPESRQLPTRALVGVYYFQDRQLLHSCLKTVVDNDLRINGEFQLSSALEYYMALKKVRALACSGEWLDCGSLSGLHRSRRRLIATRSFNSISVDGDLGLLKKASDNIAHLHQQYSWYVSLPLDLMGLVPRVLKFDAWQSGISRSQITMEYYGYSTLEEAWIFHTIPEDIWRAILRHLLSILKKFRSYPASLPQEAYKEIYWTKTRNRLATLRSSESWDYLLNCEKLSINGNEIAGYPLIEQCLKEQVLKLYDNNFTTIIHGDFHLGNVLYDIGSRLIKLLDPRGSFGSSGIYGDCRYDLAKLRHSVSGGYNHIINDMFKISHTRNVFSFDLARHEYQDEITVWFDRELNHDGFDLHQIRLIEGLLFLSMLPLHSDNKNRQLAMFIRAMTILNGCLDTKA